ncbi:hypothetical protein SDRG_05506 [Saprolegnia diclina VS20]|uniref:Cytochrome P450 oxidoreductase n=1 Tax=Saprolegnia diclina (strain VS20) TaxID=1156394 RepID=T0S3F6_SAPDV|nr:hypothetical protein SDRG_05506 [Saprolegnia diclina VS20]EQC37282.1 hypothetical protein SDRG_05506 [Saprolegnia diclina VS20]|eukprot:XP_008609444.1 hypothetical protein SDRG_05506 [Saprolegnia diclina VS20]
MLRQSAGRRAKSTAARAWDDIPTAPEYGFGPFKSSGLYFIRNNGLRVTYERFQTLHRELGPIFKLRFAPFTPYLVSVADPEATALVCRTEGAMPQRHLFPAWTLYRQQRQWPMATSNTNVFAEWKKSRASMSENLLQMHNVPAWIGRIDDVAKDVVARIATEAQHGAPVAVTNIMKAFALEAVSSLVFGKRMGCLSPDPSTPIPPAAQAFIDAVDGFFDTTQQLHIIPPEVPTWIYPYVPAYRAHAAHCDYIFDLGYQLMRDKIACTDASPEPDLLSTFLQRPELDEREAISLAIDVLFAGVDTTGNTLLWTMYCLATAPNGREMQARIRDEIGSGPMDEAALTRLSYLRACVKETLRLYPSATPNQRYAGDDVTLAGYQVPKGTSVLMATYTMSRDPDIFEHPEVFAPERWMDREKKDADNRKQQAYSTLPFGIGARSCVGRRLAETEMYLLLAHLLREMEIQWIPNEAHPKGILRLLIVPDKPLSFRFQPWSS